jgi:hypothetical protein
MWNTALKKKQGLFEWMVMPFGLCNAPTTFMHAMNDGFRTFIDEFVILYLDEILVFDRTWDEHVMHVKTILDVLKKETLYVKLSKCEFGKTSLVYLGHIVGGGQVKIDPSKFEVIVNWPKTTSITEVRILLGAVQYWRKFISKFSYVVSPLHALNSVKHVFQWGGIHKKSFDILKEKISTTPVLALPDLQQSFEI